MPTGYYRRFVPGAASLGVLGRVLAFDRIEQMF